jgi:hypothetical protein
MVGTRPGDVCSRAAPPCRRTAASLGSRRLLTRAMVTTVLSGVGSQLPPPRRPEPRPAPPRLLGLIWCSPQPFGGTMRMLGVQRQFPLRRVQRCTPAPRPLAPKPLECGGVRCSSRRSGRYRFTTPTIPAMPPGGGPRGRAARLSAAKRLAGPPAGDRRPPAPLSAPPAVPGAA